MRIFNCPLLPLVFLCLTSIGFAQVEQSNTVERENTTIHLEGDWSITTESGKPTWMRLVREGGEPKVFMRIYVGPKGPYKITELTDDRIQFEIKRKANKKRKASIAFVTAKLSDGKLAGAIRTHAPNGKDSVDAFTGVKISTMPQTAPDLSQVRFGEKDILFNGKDMKGWRPHESDKINGWSVNDGVLTNTTPKTDFSATGAYANLQTESTFMDFRLHIEFKIGTQRNSGVYLRGMYEAQVVDRDSRMQGIQGPGAIFGEIKPATNAGKAGGEWQTYDLTLVDRHVTVVLNGEQVIDNQPISAPTGGAINTNPDAAGPVYLQGDHTAVSYRNIYIEPVLKQ